MKDLIMIWGRFPYNGKRSCFLAKVFYVLILYCISICLETYFLQIKKNLKNYDSAKITSNYSLFVIIGPISLQILSYSFKFYGNFGSVLSIAYVTGAQLPRHVQNLIANTSQNIWIGAEWNFYWIWITMEKLVAKWAPGLQKEQSWNASQTIYQNMNKIVEFFQESKQQSYQKNQFCIKKVSSEGVRV